MPELIQSLDQKIKCVRVCLGLYVLALLLRVYIDADFLYAISGVVGHTPFHYTQIFFSFDLSQFFTSLHIHILFICAFVCALLLIAGFVIRFSALYLFFVFFLLHYRNPYSLGFYTQFMGWMLILLLIWPSQKQVSSVWLKYRQQLILGAQIILGISYLTSGLAKLARPEWCSGEALIYFIDLPFLRNVAWITSMPMWLIKAGTWSALLVEILFMPLFFMKQTRLAAWIAATLFQIVILITFNIPYVTLVILIFHLLAMQQSWFDKIWSIGSKFRKWQ